MIDQASANRTGQHDLEIRMRARYHLNTDGTRRRSCKGSLRAFPAVVPTYVVGPPDDNDHSRDDRLSKHARGFLARAPGERGTLDACHKDPGRVARLGVGDYHGFPNGHFRWTRPRAAGTG